MRWLRRSLLTGLLACRACPAGVLGQSPGGSVPPAANVRAAADLDRLAALCWCGPISSVADFCAAPACGGIDLPSLWALALANNPELREAAADVEEARGQRVQAGKCPTPPSATRSIRWAAASRRPAASASS